MISPSWPPPQNTVANFGPTFRNAFTIPSAEPVRRNVWKQMAKALLDLPIRIQFYFPKPTGRVIGAAPLGLL